jgi:hypothetical protein
MKRVALWVSIFTLLSFGSARAELLVLKSNDPNLKAGQTISDNKIINLAAEATVVLISRDGRSIKLKGPYSGLPGGAAKKGKDGTKLISKLAALVRGRKSIVLGASRSMRGPPPIPWMIDVSSNADQCVLDGSSPLLWRRTATIREKLILIGSKAGQRRIIDWPKGENKISWPRAMPVEDGSEVTAILDITNKAVRFKVHVIPNNLPSLAHNAAYMADRNCKDQALRLLDWLK